MPGLEPACSKARLDGWDDRIEHSGLSCNRKQSGCKPLQQAVSCDPGGWQDDQPTAGYKDAANLSQRIGCKDIFGWEGGHDRIEGSLRKGQVLCKTTREIKRVALPVKTAAGLAGHLPAFIQPKGGQTVSVHGNLQVPGTKADFKHATFDIRKRATDPGFPASQGDQRCDEIIRAGELVIEKLEKAIEE